MFCIKCGSPINEGDKFCIKCGEPVTAAPAAPEPTAPSAAPETPAAPAVPAAPAAPVPPRAPQAPQPAPQVQAQVQPPKKKSKAWIPFVVIGAVLLSTTAALIAALFAARTFMNQNKPKDRTEPDVTYVTSDDQETTRATEPSDTEYTEDGRLEPPEETSETETETAATAEDETQATTAVPAVDQAVLYEGYLKYLKDNEKAFKEYKDVDSCYYVEGKGWNTYSSSEPAKQAALIDVTGDDIPELFCIHQYDNEFTYALVVLSYVDGSVKPVLTLDSLDIFAGGYSSYVITRSKTPGELRIYEGRFDETSSEHFTAYVWNGSAFVPGDYFGNYTEIDEEEYKEIYHYFNKEDTIDKAGFEQLTEEFEAGAESIIFFNMPLDDGFTKLYLANGQSILGQTYDSILWTVSKENEYRQLAASGALQDDSEFFGKTSATYNMSSGAGAWGQSVTVNSDGTFTFNYHDANAGESGKGYDGTSYYCSGKGKFSQAVKVSETRYLVRVESMEYDVAPGTIDFEDSSEDYIMRLVATQFYSFDKGSVIEIYLPGEKTADLDESFLQWTNWHFNHKEIPSELTSCGLYNGATGSGFVVDNL
ncbi:MAG: zinc ribbon domain-containing protein [Clostridiales bacterium]|nr:zinc ribbon domain-containing protein [Clostridiales bacterium]